ncbi:hypothetical protein Phum_PHUM610150 [Pediculus humanus corporis]|uniref:Uncharacterized protein n=1 Tax=Pediculus humanus subsp. corporis TaxID=121224 RepID=E0W3T8_PEDHC|nr:uncharacterized protein Phum_PHUM610150 [Pediculus humanus corporis]EEB20294.1 hypothetical protein Phum_PHUM610150 [Pediculus humanus corporis]
MEENHMGWKLVWGVRQDVVNLFKAFASTNTMTFDGFSKAWKKMNFSQIFREPVKIRLTKSEWEEIQSIISLCKKTNLNSGGFIFMKLFLNKAFLFTSTIRTSGLEIGYKKYFKKKNTGLSGHLELGLLNRPLLNEQLVSSLVSLEELYCKKKQELLGKKNLEFIDKNFAVNLKSELDEYTAKLRKITPDHEDKNQSNQNEENDSDSNSLNVNNSKIKNKSEINSLINKKNKRKKMALKFYLAKKKAELYLEKIKQERLMENFNGMPSDNDLQFKLPELDFT